MNLDPTTAIAILTPIVGLAVTWGGLSWRIRHLEREIGKVEPLVKLVEAQGAKLEEVRNAQGRRIGDVEAAVAVLRGQFDGFERGRRSRTAAHGLPVGKGGE